MSRLRVLALTLIAVSHAGCDGTTDRAKPAVSPTGAVARSPAAAPAAPVPPAQATDLDPTAMDEGLRQALADLRHKFRCNSISGCKAHAVLTDFGERALPALQNVFHTAPRQAPWRSRTVRIIADMQLPRARPFLRQVLTDDSDAARAYAVYGLALLDDRRDQQMMHNYANAPGIIASAMTRVAAAWGLAYLGDPQYAKRFVALTHEAAAHQLGGATLRWALQLCRVPRGPSCEGTLVAAARHPSYVVRREVLMSVDGTMRSAPALVILAADPNINLARRAERALRKLSGRADVRGGEAWRAWLATQPSGAPSR